MYDNNLQTQLIADSDGVAQTELFNKIKYELCQKKID